MVEYVFDIEKGTPEPRPMGVHRAIHQSVLQSVVDGVYIEGGQTHVRFSRKLRSREKEVLDEIMKGPFQPRKHRKRGERVPAEVITPVSLEDDSMKKEEVQAIISGELEKFGPALGEALGAEISAEFERRVAEAAEDRAAVLAKVLEDMGAIVSPLELAMGELGDGVGEAFKESNERVRKLHHHLLGELEAAIAKVLGRVPEGLSGRLQGLADQQQRSKEELVLQATQTRGKLDEGVQFLRDSLAKEASVTSSQLGEIHATLDQHAQTEVQGRQALGKSIHDASRATGDDLAQLRTQLDGAMGGLGQAVKQTREALRTDLETTRQTNQANVVSNTDAAAKRIIEAIPGMLTEAKAMEDTGTVRQLQALQTGLEGLREGLFQVRTDIEARVRGVMEEAMEAALRETVVPLVDSVAADVNREVGPLVQAMAESRLMATIEKVVHAEVERIEIPAIPDIPELDGDLLAKQVSEAVLIEVQTLSKVTQTKVQEVIKPVLVKVEETFLIETSKLLEMIPRVVGEASRSGEEIEAHLASIGKSVDVARKEMATVRESVEASVQSTLAPLTKLSTQLKKDMVAEVAPLFQQITGSMVTKESYLNVLRAEVQRSAAEVKAVMPSDPPDPDDLAAAIAARVAEATAQEITEGLGKLATYQLVASDGRTEAIDESIVDVDTAGESEMAEAPESTALAADVVAEDVEAAADAAALAALRKKNGNNNDSP
jgi:hypothetical protein